MFNRKKKEVDPIVQDSKKQKKLTPKKIEENIINEAKSFEETRISENEKSKSIAWRVATGFGVLAGLMALALAMLIPLKEKVPYLVRVDNNTGVTDVLSVVDVKDVAADEQLARYFLAQYVRLREGYDWYTVGKMYEQSLLFSYPDMQSTITNYYDNPYTSPIEKYKKTKRVDVEVNNISFLDNLAQVRFTKTVTPTKGFSYDSTSGELSPEPQVTKWIATIAYDYQQISRDEKYRLINPFGFRVASYNVTQEL